MSFEAVNQYFQSVGMEHKVMVLEKSSATVEEAAEAIGCQPRQIAKTMSFFVNDKPVLIVTAGDAKIDNKKFKDTFHQKAKMIPRDLVEPSIGHMPGGAHHTVLSYDADAQMLRDWARIMDIEFVHIGKDTTPESLERDLLLADIAWKLK